MTHGEVTNILNNHSRTAPSSAPKALSSSGLPWRYKSEDGEENIEHISGSGRMAKWILDREDDNGEIAQLIEKHESGEIERTWN